MMYPSPFGRRCRVATDEGIPRTYHKRYKMNEKENLKKAAALKAIEYVKNDMIIGVGTGSTTQYFIEALATYKHRIEGAVASSMATEQQLKKHHIPCVDLNQVSDLPLYVDGADEFNQHHYLLKGGGGALTREKIIVSAAKQFICIVDDSKEVEVLGQFPLAVEVIPMARSLVARQLLK